MNTRGYIPIPEQSGYDDSRTVYQSFAKTMKSDYNTIANAVFSDSGSQALQIHDNNNTTALEREEDAPILILYRLRTEIVETIEFLAFR